MSRLEALWYSPRTESLGKKIAFAPLTIASLGFRAAVAVRNALYDHRALTAKRVDGVRIVSVGNLSVGGTGKTPAVIHLAQRALAAGKRVAVITRGYGRTSSLPVVLGPSRAAVSAEQAGDEPLIISRACPAAHVLVGADRVALAQRARDELGAELLLLDDAFQHRRLARDEDLLVVDARSRLGNGQLLPRGPLRESAKALSRATVLWLRDGVNPDDARGWPPGLPIVRTRYAPIGWTEANGERRPLEALRGLPVLAVCGIARPASFSQTLHLLGADVRALAPFGDHHRFSKAELDALEKRALTDKLTLLTTEKDRVRMPESFPAATIELGVEILEGHSHIDRCLGLDARGSDV